jgi:DNA-binding NarL/FixJ family response regulator
VTIEPGDEPRARGRRLRLLIADYEPVRMGVRLVLGDQHEICAEADDCRTAIASAQSMRPDLCLIGLDLPGGALTAVNEIARALPDASIVVLAGTSDADDLLAAIRAGAIGYVPGGADPDRLRRVVTAVARGEAAIPRAMVLDMVHELQGIGAGPEGVTVREAQVLGMLRRGQSTGAIAQRLGISPVTVRRHISSLLQKTGAADRSQLLANDVG